MGQGDDHGGVTGGGNFGKDGIKGGGSGLTGGGHHVAFDQAIVEFLMADGHAVHKFLGAEGDGQRYHGKAPGNLRGDICGGVDNDSD